MRYFQAIIAYDGTNYHGWQTQPGLKTIQDTMAKAFRSAFGISVSLRAASRTDAGVHANGQVITLRAELGINIAPTKIVAVWNHKLPLDITVKSMIEVAKDFNIHAHVIDKIYTYDFFIERPLPTYSRFGWYYGYKIDLSKLTLALKVFEGTHDFRSFCTGDEREDTVRTVISTKVTYIAARQAYRIEFRGHSFLKYMVRRMAGAALKIAAMPKLTIADLQAVLAQKNPEHTLMTAPAQGLVLQEINLRVNNLKLIK
jgi:tRNA pseudouridine38-40 synthase